MNRIGFASPVVAGCTAIVTLAIGTSLFAHEDDPKANSLIPRYVGPGWRAALDGPVSQGAGGFESSGVSLGSWLPIDDFGGNHGNGNDIWGYVSPSGREYALLGLECGTGIVEVTDPDNAVVVDTILGACSLWGDVKVFGHYAYKVTESDTLGVQVIDLSDIDNGNVADVNHIAENKGIGKSHNIIIDEVSGFLYRLGGYFNGMGIYDLNADAMDPPFVTSWSDRYIHDAQIVTYTEGEYAGRQIMFACAGNNGGWSDGRLEILDVTDKGNIFTVGEAYYADTVYSHQAWLSEDRQYIYLDDELDEYSFGTPTATRVINVADLENPLEVATFGNGLFTIDHNLFVRDGFIFQANYTSGLRVFDANDDPEAPFEVAYFDTRPEDDVTDFYGLWGNYPFLPSGTVIGSDEQRGLFVWNVDVLQNQCPLDLDGSGSVDFGDIVEIIIAWGNAGGPEDLDGSGTVDFGDIIEVLIGWGPCK